MPHLTGAERSLLHAATGEVIDAFRNGVAGVLSGQIHSYTHPPEISSFLGALGRLAKTLESRPMLLDEPEPPISVDDELCPALKLVVLLTRRRLAAELEEPREATTHPVLWASFDERLRPFNELMAQNWFKSVEPLRMPRLTDVLVLERAEKSVRRYIALPERQYDEKFHILQAPSLFLPDIRYFRRLCELRDRPVSVAFIDVDDFKRLNTAHGESAVDIRVLPILMRCLEAFVFGRGFAYRLGGDEYLALLPNCDRPTGIFLLDQLRHEIKNLDYPGVQEVLTVSIGLCSLDPDASLTDREAQERANRAKNHAKEAGRDRIASYRGSLYTDDELEVVSGD